MTKIAQKAVFASANYFLKIRVKSYVDQERAKKIEKNGADSLNRSKILWKNCRIFMCVFFKRFIENLQKRGKNSALRA